MDGHITEKGKSAEIGTCPFTPTKTLPRSPSKKGAPSPSWDLAEEFLERIIAQMEKQTKKETRADLEKLTQMINWIRADTTRRLQAKGPPTREEKAEIAATDIRSRIRGLESDEQVTRIISEEWPRQAFIKTCRDTRACIRKNGAFSVVLVDSSKMITDVNYLRMLSRAPEFKKFTGEELNTKGHLKVTKSIVTNVDGNDESVSFTYLLYPIKEGEKPQTTSKNLLDLCSGAENIAIFPPGNEMALKIQKALEITLKEDSAVKFTKELNRKPRAGPPKNEEKSAPSRLAPRVKVLRKS